MKENYANKHWTDYIHVKLVHCSLLTSQYNIVAIGSRLTKRVGHDSQLGYQFKCVSSVILTHSFTDKKSRTFPGHAWKILKDLFRACECLNIKKDSMLKVAKFINIPHCIQVSNTLHSLGATLLLLAFHLTLYKNARLSRIFFQDFLGPKRFSRTRQVLQYSRKTPGLSRMCSAGTM